MIKVLLGAWFLITPEHWRGYQKDYLPAEWQTEDGALPRCRNAGNSDPVILLCRTMATGSGSGISGSADCKEITGFADRKGISASADCKEKTVS